MQRAFSSIKSQPVANALFKGLEAGGHSENRPVAAVTLVKILSGTPIFQRVSKKSLATMSTSGSSSPKRQRNPPNFSKRKISSPYVVPSDRNLRPFCMLLIKIFGRRTFVLAQLKNEGRTKEI